MKILGLANAISGCGFHRITLPLGFMNDIKGKVTDLPDEETMNDGYDILFFNRISIFDNVLEEIKEKHKMKIVVDMDDDWVLQPNHISYNEYKKIKPQIENNLRLADMVTCTNERLAAKLRLFNSNVHIFENALPFGEHQFTTDKTEDDKVRIFWCGSITHEPDIKILTQPFKRLSIHKDKIKMVMGGYNDINQPTIQTWNKMHSHFTIGGKLPYELLKSKPPSVYMAMYEFADICVIPLESSDWHSCKSNLKILEAASKKIPCIVSAVEPYIKDKDAPVFWVEKQSDWFYHLNDLILNKNKRIEYGEKLYEWAKEKYNIFNVNEHRRKAFADLIKA